MEVKQIAIYGTNDLNDNLPNGWKWRQTPGHSFLIPSSKANNVVPDSLRMGEYEEDIGWCVPVYFSPELFSEKLWLRAKQQFIDWMPKEYEAVTDTELKEGQSLTKDNRYFQMKNEVGRYALLTAWGDWCFDVPKGYVFVNVAKVLESHVGYQGVPMDAVRISAIVTQEVFNNRSCFNEEDLIRYQRSDDYYRWVDYEKATGKDRYK